MSPQRIQRKRVAGWRTPECSCGCGKPARYVGRPGVFGSPFKVFRPIRREFPSRGRNDQWSICDQAGRTVITSIGADATQTVFHTHIHVVPRRPGDGLTLPWTGQVDL